MSQIIGYVLLFILAYLIIFIHEFGHAWMAYRRNVKLDGFSLGFGTVYRFKYKGLPIKIGILPIGGGVEYNQEAYEKMSPQSGFLIALAGPAATLISAILVAAVFALFLWTWDPVILLGKAVVGATHFITDFPDSVFPKEQDSFAKGASIFASILSQAGVVLFFKVFAALSVFLAILNLIPFPGLDGSWIVFSLAEMAFGAWVKPVAKTINVFGALALFCYMFYYVAESFW